jgi:prepilin-type N-terminal cleavage/methylation domain-containing protein
VSIRHSAKQEVAVLKSRRRGFTLTEVVVASVLLLVLFAIIYNLWGFGAKSFEYGTWFSNSTAQLRTGLRILREDLSHASYPCVVFPTSVSFNTTDPNFQLKYRAGTYVTTPTAVTTLLDFVICRADRSHLPDSPNVHGLVLRATLTAEGTTLHYTKQKEPPGPPGDTPGPGDLIDRDLILDVESVQITGNQAPAGTAGDLPGTLQITIKTHCPISTHSGAEESTSCKVSPLLVQL